MSPRLVLPENVAVRYPYLGRNVSINLGRVDAILNESEQVKGETFRPTERVKVYVLSLIHI